MVKRYKIEFGYGPESFIPIDETELEKAMFAHMTGARASFKEGSFDFAQERVRIRPDYNRAMGWNPAHKLDVDDFNEIGDKGVDREHQVFQAHVKNRIDYLKANGKLDLIGQNVEIPELQAPPVERRSGTAKSIGEIMGKK